MVMRPVFVAILVCSAFATGWTSARWRGRERARAELPPPNAAGISAGSGEDACVDRNAMAANANLVDQIGDYRRRFESARDTADSAARAVQALARAPSSRLAPTRADWARMARDERIRLRVPCARWDDAASYEVSSADSSTLDRADSPHATLAAAAGLSEAEIEAVGQAYDRALAKTWSSMRESCEASADFRAQLGSVVGERTPAMLVSLCQRAMLDMGNPSARRALGHVAELRAAGGGIERATTDEQRAAYALTTASAALYDELVSTLGRETAMRVADHDVGCVNDSVYDLHAPVAREEARAEEAIEESSE